MQAGEFVVSATRDDNHCLISRVPLHGRRLRRECSLELTKVLSKLADMGCMYPEAVRLLQQANTGGGDVPAALRRAAAGHAGRGIGRARQV